MDETLHEKKLFSESRSKGPVCFPKKEKILRVNSVFAGEIRMVAVKGCLNRRFPRSVLYRLGINFELILIAFLKTECSSSSAFFEQHSFLEWANNKLSDLASFVFGFSR